MVEHQPYLDHLRELSMLCHNLFAMLKAIRLQHYLLNYHPSIGEHHHTYFATEFGPYLSFHSFSNLDIAILELFMVEIGFSLEDYDRF